MKRIDWTDFIKSTAEKLHHIYCVPVSPVQVGSFKKFCDRWDTPAGYDRINHFFLLIGNYYYVIDFVKTVHSGDFVKIRKNLRKI